MFTGSNRPGPDRPAGPGTGPGPGGLNLEIEGHRVVGEATDGEQAPGADVTDLKSGDIQPLLAAVSGR